MAKKTVKKVAKKVATKTAKKIVKKSAAKPEIQVAKKAVQANNELRLNRIYGQVSGVKKMISEKKNAVDVIIQLKAVRAAIKALEAELLEEYLQSSATNLSSLNLATKSKKIAELKKIFLRFE